ncbi:MAG: YraN family protein [Candidatus Polarisedimenticolaceae bacterium]|nr:YraN family protein [Candidatus Polarisedimenticolaceae bacterium]
MRLPPGERGARAEEQARIYLEQKGLRLEVQNYRCRQGEIDLIMRDGATLVFIEVRYRKNTGFGSPAESVTPAKQRRICAAAAHYLQSNSGSNMPRCRLDMLAIVGREQQNIDWIKDAFQAPF